MIVSTDNCVGCFIRPRHVRGLCTKCYKLRREDGTLEEAALPKITQADLAKRRADTNKVGDTKTISGGYIGEWTGAQWIPQHRLVMERTLGRELITGENVHHINGLRDDNCSENLELWFMPQPAGQRVEQLLAYVIAEHSEYLRSALSI